MALCILLLTVQMSQVIHESGSNTCLMQIYTGTSRNLPAICMERDDYLYGLLMIGMTYEEIQKQDITKDDIIRFIYAAERHFDGVPASLIIAMAETESNFRIGCVDRTQEYYGVMQISKTYYTQTMKDLGGNDLLNPYANILTAYSIMEGLLAKYGIEASVMAYNEGPAGAYRYEKDGPSDYCNKVIERMVYYEL